MANITPLNYETYLSIIKGSLGTLAFKHAYALVDGSKKDLVSDGAYSCAFFVSSVLLIFGWLKEMHITVGGTVKDLENSGWQKVNDLRPGSVLLWAESPISNGHTHLGFYIGEEKAISNDGDSGEPKLHHFTYGQKNGQPVRKIEAIYWRNEFDNV